MAFETKWDEPKWLREIKDEHSIMMISNVPHALAIHEGRRPGARGPSASMLEDWCRRILGDERLAFPVARAIHLRGFNPDHHGGAKAAKFFWIPLERDHPKWLKFLEKKVPQIGMWATQQQIAGSWQAEARFIIGTNRGSGRWFDKGTLSSSFEIRVE